ncbi:MAG TPA: hypothetical protein PLX85_00105 [Dehalococcoidia bacterium]|nr:hypothetical protein [Dehalococcoidia bacterium]
MTRSTGIHDSGNAMQAVLFHDSIADAIGTAIAAIGGPKKAGGALWPADPVARSEARVRSCLNAERAEKFSPDEVMQLARLARAAGDHSIMNYLAAELGYEIRPLDPQDQMAALQQQYIDAARSIRSIAERIERIQVRAVG